MANEAGLKRAMCPNGQVLTMLSQIELRDYETTLLRVLYDRDDIWLKTPQQIVRWLAYCRANAHTKEC